MVNGGKNDVKIESVAQLCVEYWKLAAATEKALNGALFSNGKRLEAQLKFSKRQLDVLLQDLGLRLVDFSGERFHPGLAVSVDNPGDFEEDEALVVGKTIEPTVMSDMSVIRLGRVIVAPVEQEEE
ncbi:hypothetical protein NIT7321_03360 [Phaeobacter italicus]|uniref:Heat shock protein GrpE n=1 Tax=Phaeobacter italicus TaxID=481446 RepID=A0A0H5D701_9RHOB|nr:hypothetical protein [Phaeobacter italicus]CRL12483.1 hypothetical protein NIT7321_03360 [Phaeobacter italicus]